MLDDRVYEQAVKALNAKGWGINADYLAEAAGAVWTARYGCPQCAGTGELPGADIDGAMTPCPRDHVQMVNPHTGERVWCDPAKAEWRQSSAIRDKARGEQR